MRFAAALASFGMLAGCTALRATGPDGTGATALTPRAVSAEDLRWRDISGGLYPEAFRGLFSYSDPQSQVTVSWNESAPMLSGTLTATGLKPNFAYQMKLVGRESVTSLAHPADAKTDPEAWASWQLGHNGRWWCVTDEWNVSDADLGSHIRRGHFVVGYVLFDFLLTDANGNATKPFTVDSTYHVLWRTSQRTRSERDSAVARLNVRRGAWGYGNAAPEPSGTVGVFAEYEPHRPAPGRLRLPGGRYPVLLNLTEESFHDNLSNSMPEGGFWAQVLEAPITFTDTSPD